jgi:hypothetical protein
MDEKLTQRIALAIVPHKSSVCLSEAALVLPSLSFEPHMGAVNAIVPAGEAL